MEKVFGVYLKQVPSTEVNAFDFEVFISSFQGKHGKNNEFFSFFTSKKINSNLKKIINSINLKKPKKIGVIGIDQPKQKEFCTWNYYPVSNELTKKNFEVIKKALEKTGFASKTELRILMHLKKKFPEHTVRSSQVPSGSRMKQLMNHGRKIGEPYYIHSTIEKIRNYTVRKAIGKKRFNMHLKRIKELKQNQKKQQKKNNVVKRKI
jgi:hypothetical protein